MTKLISAVGKFINVFFANIRSIIALLFVVGSFAFLFTLISKVIPPSNKDAVNTVAGMVIGTLLSVGAFYFGSSKNESDAKKAVNDKQ